MRLSRKWEWASSQDVAGNRRAAKRGEGLMEICYSGTCANGDGIRIGRAAGWPPTPFGVSMWLGRPHAMRYHDVQLNLPGELRDQGVGTSRVATISVICRLYSTNPLEVSDED
jgi:hypothetical protein